MAVSKVPVPDNVMQEVKRRSAVKPVPLNKRRISLAEQAHLDNLAEFWEELNGTA